MANEYEEADKELGRELAKRLCDVTNGGTEKWLVEGFVEGMLNQHRTLQASAIRMVLNGLMKYANTARSNDAIDLRNSAAVELLEKISPVLQKTHIPYI